MGKLQLCGFETTATTKNMEIHQHKNIEKSEQKNEMYFSVKIIENNKKNPNKPIKTLKRKTKVCFFFLFFSGAFGQSSENDERVSQ